MISKDTGHALNAFMLPSFSSIVRQCRYPPNKASMIIIERQTSFFRSEKYNILLDKDSLSQMNIFSNNLNISAIYSNLQIQIKNILPFELNSFLNVLFSYLQI